MSSIVQTFQKRTILPSNNQALPVSQTDSSSSSSSFNSNNEQQQQEGLRKRLSSLSLRIQPPISSETVASWASQRSKSVSSMGEYAGTSLRKWWDWGWSWVLSKKPTFAQDLEMNEEETRVLGCHNKGSWRHVFYKVKSDIRKLMGSDNVGLPQTCKYTSFDYSKNFDETRSFRG
ncbi:hypothetical protein ACOSQ3_006124 [Xanthoceras sorbifolium]